MKTPPQGVPTRRTGIVRAMYEHRIIGRIYI